MVDSDNIHEKVTLFLRKQRKSNASWLREDYDSKYRRLCGSRLEKIVNPFLADGSTQKKLVPNALRSISTIHMRNAMEDSLNRSAYPERDIASYANYQFWHYECADALMGSDDPGGYDFALSDFISVALLLSLGWMNHAHRLAKTLYDRWYAQKDGFGAIRFEALPQYLPWFSLKLYKAWQDSDEEFEYEPDDEQLGDLYPLLETLLDPRPAVFGEALHKAADFHVMGMGLDDYDPVNNEYFWFFPVELLAACRIREQRGLDIPHVDHPLFEAAPLCRLPRPLPIPHDDLLAKLLPAYAKATGTLDLTI